MVGLEISEDKDDIDILIGCIGGGGLMSGIGSYLEGTNIKLL